MKSVHQQRKPDWKRRFENGALVGLSGAFIAVSAYLFLEPSLPQFFGTDRATAAIVPTPKAKKRKVPYKNWGLINGLSKSHISALDAWKIEKGSKKVIVAVIDTGIDPKHPDLKGNLWKGKVQFGNRVYKDVYGWDFHKNKPNPVDKHGHGTHIAGIIGAISNPHAGISGVAQKVSIMPVRYFAASNSGQVNLENTIRALHFAIDNGAKIINYSGGGPAFSHEEYLALKRAQARGILIVAAAGNETQDADIRENFYYPAAYGLPNIISVAATDIHNKLLPSSNWGVRNVDVAAPGENIYSTMPKRGYGYQSGTSQATAFVTGIAALLLAKTPTLTPPELKKLILDTADSIPGLKGKTKAGGRVNAHRALLRLRKLKRQGKKIFVKKPIKKRPLRAFAD